MKGTIVNYRGSYRTQAGNQMVVLPENATVDASKKLIGRTVVLSVGTKQLRGVATALHGRKGALRVRFSRGVPGQALGTEVEILE